MPSSRLATGPAEAHNPAVLPVFTFLDYRAYTREWLAARKGRPSLRTLSKRVGLSPAMLSAILNAQRELSPVHAEALANEMTLGPEERTYFFDLVAAEQAETRGRRLAAMERVFAARRYRTARRVADDAWELFSRWYLPAIAELAACPAFQEDPAWIARTLCPPILPEEAAEALTVLLRLGVLTRDEGGKLRTGADTWATDHEASRAASLGLHRLHLGALERAGKALELPRESRHFATVAAPLDAAALGDLKQRVGRFMEEAMQRCAQSDIPDRVVQLSVQIVPLAQIVGEQSDPSSDQSMLTRTSGLPP